MAGWTSRAPSVALCGLALAGLMVVVAASPLYGPEALHGVVRGVVVRPPGQDPRSGAGGGSGTYVPVNGDPVRAHDERGHVVASTVTAPPDGSFSFTLSPGSYRITEDIFGIGRQVELRGGSTVSVTLTIPSAH
ncbi:hypothetical protein ACWGI9_20275 [Streptomyces sp. NPDC054833]